MIAVVRTAVLAAWVSGVGIGQQPAAREPAKDVASASRADVAPFGLTIHYVRPRAGGPTFSISQVFPPGAVTHPVDIGTRSLLLRDGPIVDVRPVSYAGAARAVAAASGEDCAAKSVTALIPRRRVSVFPAATAEEALMLILESIAFQWQFGFGFPPFCDCASGACAGGSARSCQLASVSVVPEGDIVVEGQTWYDLAWIVHMGPIRLSCACACK